MPAMTDLSKVTRAYLLGFCRNDPDRAEAIARLVFQPHTTSIRRASKEAGISTTHMHRLTRRFKRGLDELITSRKFTSSDLIVKG